MSQQTILQTEWGDVSITATDAKHVYVQTVKTLTIKLAGQPVEWVMHFHLNLDQHAKLPGWHRALDAYDHDRGTLFTKPFLTKPADWSWSSVTRDTHVTVLKVWTKLAAVVDRWLRTATVKKFVALAEAGSRADDVERCEREVGEARKLLSEAELNLERARERLNGQE